MFNDLSIRAKLLIGFLSMGMLVTVAGYFGIKSTQQADRVLHDIVNSDLPRTHALLELRNVAGEIAAQTAGFKLLGEETTQAEGTPAAARKYQLLASIDEMRKWEDHYRRHARSEGRERLFLQELSRSRDGVVSAAVELIDLKEQGILDQRIKEKEAQLEAAQLGLRRVITRALATESAALEVRLGQAKGRAAAATRTSLVVSLAAILLGFVLSAVIARVVSKPVIELKNTAIQIAQGHRDKRVTVSSKDEIGQLGMAFNNMADRVENLIDVVQRSQVESVRAREEAERANQAKSEFLSRMSHELRTPLNAILGFAQLLEMEAIAPDQRESVAHILKGGRHLLELVNEVLDLARIEEGRLAISPEPVSVREVVQESLELIAPLADQRAVQLNAHVPQADSRYVVADRQRLKQVLLNVLGNAIKYNRQEGAVTISYEDAPRGRLRINVRDTGPGIPPERLGRLFTPFDRLGAEHTGVEGTGLGLALSKRLVEAMKGTMGVESTVGRGSTFWLELTLADAPRLEPESEAIRPLRALEASHTVRKVLYIEDNLVNLALIEHLLAHYPGLRLLSSIQGRLGLDLAREHHPDLILLDLQLPDISGDEVFQQLQDSPQTRDIPVIVLSADATPRRADRLLAAGVRAYLAKPLEVRKLLDLLDEVLREREPSHARGQE